MGLPESPQWMEIGSDLAGVPSLFWPSGQGPMAKEAVCCPLTVLSPEDQTHPDTLVGLWRRDEYLHIILPLGKVLSLGFQ